MSIDFLEPTKITNECAKNVFFFFQFSSWQLLTRHSLELRIQYLEILYIFYNNILLLLL